MKRNPLLHSELSQVIASMGHGDVLVIGDAGLPVPPGVRRIDLALSQGVQDMASLKMRTRVSMGDCQGRMCVGYCSDRLRESTGRQDVGWLRPRFPLEPVPFSAFTNACKDA